MQLYKVHQQLGAAPPDPRILHLQPVETPFKKSWVHPWSTHTIIGVQCILCGYMQGP